MQKPSLDSRKSLLSFEVGLFLDYCLVLDDASGNVCTIHGMTCQKPVTKRNTFGGGWGGAHSREVWVELCRGGLQTPTLFKTKIAHFATLFKTGDTTFCRP